MLKSLLGSFFLNRAVDVPYFFSFNVYKKICSALKLLKFILDFPDESYSCTYI